MAGAESMFCDSDSDEEIVRILLKKDSKNIKRATKNAVRVFYWAVGDVKKAEKDEESLDKNLAKFFANAKKQDGRKHKATVLLTIRHGLRGIDIVSDKSFEYSTTVFKAAVVDLFFFLISDSGCSN